MLNSNRLSVRALVLSLIVIAPIAYVANAETTRHTRTTTTTTVESDDEGEVTTAPAAPTAPAPVQAPTGIESQLSQTFGSKATSGMAGCKTEVASKDVVKDLKRECAAWVKEQKADLGKNYLGNTCEDTCDDCGMSLVRCKVTGTVRYRKSAE